MPSPRELISLAQAQAPFFVGVDLGGTNVKIGLVDNLGRPFNYRSISTDVERGADDATRRMAEAVNLLIEETGVKPSDIAQVGLGSPGTMDIPAGMLLKPVNLHGWDNFPIRDRLSTYCGRPVTFANDANAAAYGEFWVGTGRDLHSMVLFTLGTGIGSGIIIGDRAIDGEHSHGGECGHIIIDCSADARICGCGKRGHLEAYASATAVIKRTLELLEQGRPTTLIARVAAGQEVTPLMVADEAEAGDALSLEIIMQTAAYMGVGIVNLMHTIDPNGVLLGGGMTFGGNETPLGRQFLERVKQEVRQRALPIPAALTTIDYATLGGDAGFIGAAGLARLEYRSK